jgi:hypothetical protein
MTWRTSSYLWTNLELDFFKVLANTTNPHKSIIPTPESQICLALNSHREYWQVMIVNVLTNQVHTPRSPSKMSRLLTELFEKSLAGYEFQR